MNPSTNEDAGQDPEIILAEVVEVLPGRPMDDVAGPPWEWREVRAVRPRRRWRLPLFLFIATCLSTLWVGTIQDLMSFESLSGRWLEALTAGLWYAVPVMTILVCHEMGHFIQARRYGVRASLPHFIPIPLPPFGTFGAVIAMEPRVGGRRALFDIGITGPLAGLVPTLIFLVVGLHYSHAAPLQGDGSVFGAPLLLQLMTRQIFGPLPPHYSIVMHPMAFAGWVGLFITSLNLIPIGQLDGGHVLYALLRRGAHQVATLLLFLAVFFVIWQWEYYKTWTIMVILLWMMGPIHPPTANDDEPLGLGRHVLGWLTLAFILVGFTPVPLLR